MMSSCEVSAIGRGLLLMMTQEEFMDVLAMRRQGMTYVEIADETGYHPTTIAKWVREGGPPTKRIVGVRIG